MHTNVLVELQAEIAQAFDACLHDAFSRALASQAAMDPRVAQDLLEQWELQRCRDQQPPHWGDARRTPRQAGVTAQCRPLFDVIDVQFREVADTPRQA